MAWNKIDVTFWRHKKTMVLACELGVHPAQAAGHVGTLWSWAIDSAQDGILPEQDIIIASAAQWDGKPDFFVNALIFAGFIDDDYMGKRELHDWADWTEALIRRRKEDRERLRKMRADRASATRRRKTSRNVRAMRPRI